MVSYETLANSNSPPEASSRDSIDGAIPGGKLGRAAAHESRRDEPTQGLERVLLAVV
ncbi:hypothetical protein KaCgl_15080 [Corynebacterium glutamicum]|nr:hypothetical protein KaCgl_15080 [Corynebacterium glutamicum]